MRKQELITDVTQALEKSDDQQFVEFATEYLGFLPDGEVDNKAFSHAYKTYREKYPELTELDRMTKKLSQIISETCDVKLRLVPGTRSGTGPTKRGKAKAEGQKPTARQPKPDQGKETSAVMVTIQIPTSKHLVDLRLPHPLPESDARRIASVISSFYGL